MKAVLLVGGEGTRLRPLTLEVPKPLAPILNLPYLEQLFIFLRRFGVDEIILTACYLSDQIETFCKRGRERGMKLTYVVEETPLGTGGAVGNVAGYLDETFLVFNGDILTGFDLHELIKFHREKKCAITLALVPVSDPSRYGVADLRTDGRIEKFVEKPRKEEAPSSCINAGIYVIEPGVLNRIPAGVRFSIEKQLFPPLAEEGLLYGVTSQAHWLDIGTPDGYLQAHQDFLSGKISLKTDAIHQEGVWREPNVVISESAIIHPPIFIGEGSSVEERVEIGPDVVLGRNCRLKKEARVSESVLWEHVSVGEIAELRRVIIGSNFRVENGTSWQYKIACRSGEKAFSRA